MLKEKFDQIWLQIFRKVDLLFDCTEEQVSSFVKKISFELQNESFSVFKSQIIELNNKNSHHKNFKDANTFSQLGAKFLEQSISHASYANKLNEACALDIKHSTKKGRCCFSDGITDIAWV